MTRLHCLHTLDSPQRAAHCRAVLDIPRQRAAELGREAVDAARAGIYRNARGEEVQWQPEVEQAIAAKRSLPPDAELPSPPSGPLESTRLQVANETTLAAARRLLDDGERVLALNFANGIHPGGGFLGGARAQEETLCRSSALYVTLEGDPMYAEHEQRPLPDSTDWAILSPDVPVFRDDDGAPLDRPWLLSFLTCAAPYAPGVGHRQSAELLRQRIERVVAIAEACGTTGLVLGAWGCGAFGNDPAQTARDFRSALEARAGAFSQVVFAIADWSSERRFLGPFAAEFSP
jgi:uncharacterized protein (TIGR02452 family)